MDLLMMRINVGFKKIVSVRSKTVNYSRLVENYGLIIIVMRSISLACSKVSLKPSVILYTYRRYMCDCVQLVRIRLCEATPDELLLARDTFTAASSIEYIQYVALQKPSHEIATVVYLLITAVLHQLH